VKPSSRASRESDLGWEATFDAIRDLILLVDVEGRVELGNRAARERLGLTAEELAGRSVTELLGSEVADLAGHARDAGREEHREPVRLPNFDGVYTATAWPRSAPSSGPVVILRDVSERVRLREQLIHSEKLSALGELISGIAHELNNPLTAVLGYAQILETRGEGKFTEELTHLKEESLRASRIIRNLLSFARRTERRIEPNDLNEIVRLTVSLREYDLRVRNIDVELDLEANLPRSMMDRAQIQQIVLNLLNNAEHAIHGSSESGRILIETRREGDRLHLSVTDDGPGVPAEHRGQIFHPFFTTKPVGTGTGLGLPICFGLVRDHGGEIALDPDYEGGARFTVSLPIEVWRPSQSS